MEKEDAKIFIFVSLLLTEYQLPPQDVAPRISLRSKFLGKFLNSVQFSDFKANPAVPSMTQSSDPALVLTAVQLLIHLFGNAIGI